ncbi:YveK family protein [Cohnella sp. AR92]|uniref:YveK family protein n=1 Tax=Cohnella sp. AR92 TaxID=648716 RepID=UPI00131548CA|nr:hypothetical protein [Cohnella sp. AR92]
MAIIAWSIAVTAVIGGYFTFFVAEARYEAVSSFMILNQPPLAELNNDHGDPPELILDLLAGAALANDFQSIILSNEFLEQVEARLNSEYEWARGITLEDLHQNVDVTFRSDTRVLNIIGYDSSPEHAAILSNTVNKTFQSFATKLTAQDLIIPIKEAEVPKSADSPKPVQYMTLSIIVGLLTGLILSMQTARISLLKVNL